MSLGDGGFPWDIWASWLCGGVSGESEWVWVTAASLRAWGPGSSLRHQNQAQPPPHPPAEALSLPASPTVNSSRAVPPVPRDWPSSVGRLEGEKLGGWVRPRPLLRRRRMVPADPGGPGSPLPAASCRPRPSPSLPSLPWPLCLVRLHPQGIGGPAPGGATDRAGHSCPWWFSRPWHRGLRLCAEVSGSQSAWEPLSPRGAHHPSLGLQAGHSECCQETRRRQGLRACTSFIHSFGHPVTPPAPGDPGPRRAQGAWSGHLPPGCETQTCFCEGVTAGGRRLGMQEPALVEIVGIAGTSWRRQASGCG